MSAAQKLLRFSSKGNVQNVQWKPLLCNSQIFVVQEEKLLLSLSGKWIMPICGTGGLLCSFYPHVTPRCQSLRLEGGQDEQTPIRLAVIPGPNRTVRLSGPCALVLPRGREDVPIVVATRDHLLVRAELTGPEPHTLDRKFHHFLEELWRWHRTRHCRKWSGIWR